MVPCAVLQLRVANSTLTWYTIIAMHLPNMQIQRKFNKLSQLVLLFIALALHCDYTIIIIHRAWCSALGIPKHHIVVTDVLWHMQWFSQTAKHIRYSNTHTSHSSFCSRFITMMPLYYCYDCLHGFWWMIIIY